MPLYRLGIDSIDGELLFHHDAIFTDSKFRQICKECIIEAIKKDILKNEYDFISGYYPYMGKLTKSDDGIDLFGNYDNFPDIEDEMTARGFIKHVEYPTAYAHIDNEDILGMPEFTEFAKKWCEDNGKIYSINSSIPDISAPDMETAIKLLNDYQ